MQDILSFVQAPAPVTLAPSTTETPKSESGDGSFSESFFSMILGQYTKENEQTELSEFTQELPITTVGEGTLDLAAHEQEAKSIDEHLLDDLLSVVNALQQDPKTTTFPTLNASPALEKLLVSETTRQEFASVKSVSDLMDLSQKYNLGLEKLSISQESLESLQTKFPKLTQNNFFDDLKTALDATQNLEDNTIPKAATTNIMTLLDKQPSKPETTPTASMLSTLINTTPTQSKTVEDTKAVPNTPVVQEPLIVNEKQQNPLAQALQMPKEESVQATITPVVETQTQTPKTTTNHETKKSTASTVLAESIPEEEPVQMASTRVTEVKKESLSTSEEDSVDLTLKVSKPEKKVEESTPEETTQTQKIVKNEENEVTQTSSDESQPITDVKNDIKVNNNKDIPVKNTPVKESLNQFASDLKEKIEAYKPPIMKVELSLSPKSLGDVDVTLLTRGNNLHVNISSNTSTMSLFTQNQNDVKSALINMGFTNLEMNFSDQNNKEQAQQNNQKQNNGNFEEFNEEETALLEIIIPQYV